REQPRSGRRTGRRGGENSGTRDLLDAAGTSSGVAVTELTLRGSSMDDEVGRTRPQDELVLWTTPAVRARRHPRAIAGLWAWQTVLALLASGPTAGLARAA